MHLLLTAIGSYGDVHPMIGLAVAMQARGHDVTLITNPYFEREVAAAGLRGEFVSTIADYEEVTGHADIWHPRRGVGLVFRWAAERLLRPLYERVRALHRPGETVIAAHPLDIASRVARESLGVPVVSVVFAPMALWSAIAPPRLSGAPVGPAYPSWWNRGWFWLGDRLVMRRIVQPPLALLREELGLPAVGRLFPDWWYGGGPTLCLFPDWFVTPSGAVPSDWPPGAALAGFPLWDGAVAEGPTELDAWIDAGDAPVVFTPGSANRAAKGFLAAAVDACQRLGRRGLLLTKFGGHLPGALPASVRRESFVPLSRVLPRAAAFVHHGGVGSCAQGLAAGAPQLIQPMAFDQADNAWRLERLGVARSLPPKRFTGRRVAAALGPLLDSPQLAAQCADVAARLDGVASRRRACESLERLAAVAPGREAIG